MVFQEMHFPPSSKARDKFIDLRTQWLIHSRHDWQAPILSLKGRAAPRYVDKLKSLFWKLEVEGMGKSNLPKCISFEIVF